MAKIIEGDRLDNAQGLAEERFLLLVQTRIQELLEGKGLRYRDLARRLGVSEARVSQMLSDDAANLTIRTVAKIYHQLGETPVLYGERELGAAGVGRHLPCLAESVIWQVAGDHLNRIQVPRGEVVDAVEEGSHTRARQQEWIAAESAMLRRA